jgi:hypothetical protein
MALGEPNNIHNLILTFEGFEHKTTGTWGYCGFCQKEYYNKCTNSFAILADADAENAKIIIEQKDKPSG